MLGIPTPEAQHGERRRCVLAWRELPLHAECLVSRATLGQDDLELPGRRALYLSSLGRRLRGSAVPRAAGLRRGFWPLLSLLLQATGKSNDLLANGLERGE